MLEIANGAASEAMNWLSCVQESASHMAAHIDHLLVKRIQNNRNPDVSGLGRASKELTEDEFWDSVKQTDAMLLHGKRDVKRILGREGGI